ARRGRARARAQAARRAERLARRHREAVRGAWLRWPSVISPSVDNLVAQLSRLPGVGTRTAQRLAFHLLRAPKDEALALAAAVQEVKERVRFCRECGNLTEDELCAICEDTRRDRTIVCVVEQPVDLISVEKTHEYRG